MRPSSTIVGQLFYDLHVARGLKLRAQRLERQQTCGRLLLFDSRSPTSTGALKWRCKWLNDCTIVKSVGS